MTLDSTASKGIEFQKGDGSSPESFTKIAGVNDLPAFMAQKSTIEDTAIDDSNRHYIHGIGEPPSITLTLVWDTDDTQQTALVTEYDNETECNYRSVCPDSPASIFTMRAIVTGYSTPYGGINALLQQDFTFQLLENDNGDIITES